MATIRKISRPTEWNPNTESMNDCGYVRLVVDVHDDGSLEDVVCLNFADHAGLQAEWEAGESTAVLLAALGVVVGEIQGDDLTDEQRGAIGQQIELPQE